jgi:DNA polymerase-3 subunit delta'
MVLKVTIGVDEAGALPLPWLAAPMQRAQALAKSHALLIQGPAGVGQFELGLLLAQAWLCESSDAAAARPCGRCDSCRLVRQRSHPDLMLVVPDAMRLALDWVGPDDPLLKSESKAKPSNEVRIAQVRSAIEAAQRTSGRGRGKAVLIHPAEAMNGVSANALLKTLEEPGGAMRLLLCSAAPDRLLATVRSRCQRLVVDLPAPELALAWLLGVDANLTEVGAKALLAVAGGAPLEALTLLQEGVDPRRLSDLPQRIASGDAAALAGLPIQRAIELLLKLAHDAMRLAALGGLAGDDSRRFYSTAAFPVGAAMPALVTWHKALLRVARHADHPWNAGLLVEALVAQAKIALMPPRRSGSTQPLHSPR